MYSLPCFIMLHVFVSEVFEIRYASQNLLQCTGFPWPIFYTCYYTGINNNTISHFKSCLIVIWYHTKYWIECIETFFKLPKVANCLTTGNSTNLKIEKLQLCTLVQVYQQQSVWAQVLTVITVTFVVYEENC